MIPDRYQNKTERVTEIYVAVFPVALGDGRKAEVILAGVQKDNTSPHMIQVRATIETHAHAVPNLVTLCDEIVDDQAEIESYRLLKFDENGIHKLSPDDFRTFSQPYTNITRGVC